MLRVQTYIKIEPKIISAPILEETLRFDLESSDYAIDALSRLILYMLRDGKSLADVVEVTLLPRAIIEDTVFRLQKNGLLENLALSSNALKILSQNERVDWLNQNSAQIYFDLLTRLRLPSLDSIKISSTRQAGGIAEILGGEQSIPLEKIPELNENLSNISSAKKILYAERRINFLPSLGGSIFDGCVELNCEEIFVAEIPVRIYNVEFGGGRTRKIIVELLSGLAPNVGEDFLSADGTAAIRFALNPEFSEYYCDGKIAHIVGLNGEISGEGVSYILAEISSEVVGDFVCG